MRAVAAGSRDADGLADALASMEKRLARMQARLDELDADVERQRREKRELDVEIAIRRGALELLGKEPGADPENLTNREETILVKQISEAQSVSVKSLRPVVGLAHSTYHYRLNAMRRPDRDAWLLPLVEGGVREQREALRLQARAPGIAGHGDNGVGQTRHETHDQARHGAVVQEREALQLVQGQAH